MDEILRKMNYKAGKAVILGAPAEFSATLSVWKKECPIAFEFGEEVPTFLLVFADSIRAFKAVVRPAAAKADAFTVFWVAFPKKTSEKYDSDLNRDVVWKLMEPLGFGPARNVAIDGDWSALRFSRS
ncbi:MAG: hypothetical protein NT061_13235 [Spirochaetes bacterium]|nr:hypothetical protein [Spirochaetota bacterium]